MEYFPVIYNGKDIKLNVCVCVYVTVEQWWREIPSTLLRAELARRDQLAHSDAGMEAMVIRATSEVGETAAVTEMEALSCGSRGSRGSYNTTLHVLALFLILILSTLGMFITDQGPHLYFFSSYRRSIQVMLTRIKLWNSVLFTHHRPPISSCPSSPSFPLHVPALRYRCTYSHGLCTLTTHRFRLTYRSVSTAFLE